MCNVSFNVYESVYVRLTGVTFNIVWHECGLGVIGDSGGVWGECLTIGDMDMGMDGGGSWCVYVCVYERVYWVALLSLCVGL